MKNLIASINSQITEAIEIGKTAGFKPTSKSINKILLCGLGGSGIGGAIISQLLKQELKVPFVCVNDYNVPAFVDNQTLLIASSYSGNTEETIAAVKEGMSKGAEICVITSGGKILEMAKENGWNHAIVPGGEQPRAMLAYSLVQQIYILQKYGLTSNQYVQDLDSVTALIEENKDDMQAEAKTLAEKLHGSLPVIYADSSFGGVATRVKQQINENAKELCWSHVLPEMTHNELVGWAGGKSNIAPVYLSTDYDHERTTYRWNISKEIISKYTSNINEIKAKGDSQIAQIFYLIHLTDWMSWFLSDLKKIDATEVEVIIHLKSVMGKK
ncbi:MAG: glucose/mannose-6-phosphate isomerase [Arenicella sp.]|jgi:glucose/mannose-6-phosphate isomerase